MIVKDKTDVKIEEIKKQLKLEGDVYVYNNHFVENLESHKHLIPNSEATTIEEAYEERIKWEEEQKEQRKMSFEKYKLEHPEEFEEGE